MGACRLWWKLEFPLLPHRIRPRLIFKGRIHVGQADDGQSPRGRHRADQRSGEISHPDRGGLPHDAGIGAAVRPAGVGRRTPGRRRATCVCDFLAPGSGRDPGDGAVVALALPLSGPRSSDRDSGRPLQRGRRGPAARRRRENGPRFRRLDLHILGPRDGDPGDGRPGLTLVVLDPRGPSGDVSNSRRTRCAANARTMSVACVIMTRPEFAAWLRGLSRAAVTRPRRRCPSPGGDREWCPRSRDLEEASSCVAR